MSYRELERVDEIGTIVNADGSVLGERRCQLSLLQDMVDDGVGGCTPGMRIVIGRIVLEGQEGHTLVAAGAELTLRLKDGRRLLFVFTNRDGTIAARGPVPVRKQS